MKWDSKRDGNGKPCRDIYVGPNKVLSIAHHPDWEITQVWYPDHYPVDRLFIEIEPKGGEDETDRC